MPSRRKAIGTLVAAATALPAAAQHAHQLVQVKRPALPQPKVFDAAELKALAALVDVILPRTDTPGASDAGVHLLIDELAAAVPARVEAWRACLAWFDAAAFASLTPAEQNAKMRKATEEAPEHFKLLKDTTIDLYYRTREGLGMELGWNGATYLPEFRGCTHPEHQS